MIDRVMIVIRRILQSLHIQIPEAGMQGIEQFIKFACVGLSNTALSYFLYAGSLLLMRQTSIPVKFGIYIAHTVQFVISVAWSFFWNNRFVFKLEEGQHRTWWKALLKTYAAYAFTGLLVNALLLGLWVNVLGISEFIAPFINLIFNVPLNFVINKFWAFRDHQA